MLYIIALHSFILENKFVSILINQWHGTFFQVLKKYLAVDFQVHYLDPLAPFRYYVISTKPNKSI